MGSNSMTTLETLPIECLRNITSFLFASDITLLYIASGPLHRSLVQGGVEEFVHQPSTVFPAHLTLPRVIQHFYSLRILHIELIREPLTCLDISLLPQSIETLVFSFPTAMDTIRPYLCIDNVFSKCRLEIILPRLSTLEICASIAFATRKGQEISLPTTLTSLKLPGRLTISEQQLLTAPNLTSISASFSCDWKKDFNFPRCLTSWEDCSPSYPDILPYITPLVELQSLSISLKSSPLLELTSMAVLPRSLRSLSLYCSFQLNSQMLSQLPSKLTYLNIRSNYIWSWEQLQQLELPQSLRTLHLDFKTFNFRKAVESIPVELVRWIPPNLTDLKLSLATYSSKLSREAWQALPTSLTKISDLIPENFEDFSVSPASLTEIQVGESFMLSESDLQHWPRNLTPLQPHSISITRGAIPSLLSKPGIVELMEPEISLFAIEGNESADSLPEAFNREPLPCSPSTRLVNPRYLGPEKVPPVDLPMTVLIPNRFHQLRFRVAHAYATNILFSTALVDTDNHVEDGVPFHDSEAASLCDLPINSPLWPALMSKSLAKGVTGLKTLHISSIDGLSQPVRLMSEIPATLTSLSLQHLSLPSGDLFTPHLRNLVSLQELVIHALDSPIGNPELSLVPPKLTTLNLVGPESHFDSTGFSRLPRTLFDIILPPSPTFNAEWAEISAKGNPTSILPSLLIGLSFELKIPGCSQTVPSPWCSLMEQLL